MDYFKIIKLLQQDQQASIIPPHSVLAYICTLIMHSDLLNKSKINDIIGTIN